MLYNPHSCRSIETATQTGNTVITFIVTEINSRAPYSFYQLPL